MRHTAWVLRVQGARTVLRAAWVATTVCLAVFATRFSALAQGSPDIVWTASGHTEWVYSVAFSSNGQLLASGAFDSTARLWQASDGRRLRTFTGHTGGVLSVAISPNGQLVASGGTDRTVRLWRVADGEQERELSGHTAGVTYDQNTGTGVRSVRYSPSGEFFAYGRSDARVVLARNPFFTPPPQGDANGDGCVNDQDLLVVLFNFGNQGGAGDVNNDGTVNDRDLLVVLLNFGRGCGS